MKELSYVRSFENNVVDINCADHERTKFLKSIGAKRRFLSKKGWVIEVTADYSVWKIFALLRDQGFLFSYDEHGWGASDLFRYYREKGLLEGGFDEVLWEGDGKYRVFHS